RARLIRQLKRDSRFRIPDSKSTVRIPQPSSLWNSASGIRHPASGIWNLESGIWNLESHPVQRDRPASGRRFVGRHEDLNGGGTGRGIDLARPALLEAVEEIPGV